MLRNFNYYFPRRTIFLVVSENLLIFGIIQLAVFMRSGFETGSGVNSLNLMARVVLITLVCQMSLYYHDLYDLRIVKESKELFVRLIQSVGISAILVAGIYLVFPSTFLGQGVFVLSTLFLLTLLSVWRVTFRKLSQIRDLKKPLVILGMGHLAEKLYAEILSRPEVGVRIVGFISDDPETRGNSVNSLPVLGYTSELLQLVAREKVAGLVVAMPESRGKLPVRELLELKLQGVSIEEATSLYEQITGKIAVENLRPSWLIFSHGFKKSRLALFYKRVFGIVFSLVGLLICSPLMAVVAVLIKLDSKGPVFFKQQRVGENGKVFELLKFRSMYHNAETKTGPIWAQKNDARVTRVGNLIRRIRLDEVPQFINVLLGDMSFVGPRPERPNFVEQLTEVIPYYNQRHTVKPGITGWAQIKFRYGNTIEDTLEKLQYDLFYIKHMSISLDLFIILQTIKIVMQGRGAY